MLRLTSSLVLTAAVACTETGEPVLVDGSAFDHMVIDVPMKPPAPEPTREPEEGEGADEAKDERPDRRKSLIIMDVRDEPGFWNPEETDRLPLELRLHSFGSKVHVEIRNAGRERVYWCGPDHEEVRPLLYGEGPDGSLFRWARCLYEPPKSSNAIVAFPMGTLHTLGPGEALPLATLDVTRTAHEWVTVWMEDTLLCLFLPVDAVLRAGAVLSVGRCSDKTEKVLDARFRFEPPDPRTGFPEIVYPWKLGNLLPPTRREYDTVPTADARISNGIRIHPAEKPFQGPALRQPGTPRRRARGRSNQGAPKSWRRSLPAVMLGY